MSLQCFTPNIQKKWNCDASYRICFKTAWTYIPAWHHNKANIVIQGFPLRILPRTITESNMWVGKSTKALLVSQSVYSAIATHVFVRKPALIPKRQKTVSLQKEHLHIKTMWPDEQRQIRNLALQRMVKTPKHAKQSWFLNMPDSKLHYTISSL